MLKKLLRLLRTFSNPLLVAKDRAGRLPKGSKVIHALRNGLRFLVRPGTQDTMVLFDIFAANEYQPADLPQFKLRPGWKVLDFGANIGAFSLQAHKAGCTVFAYEALPENFSLLLDNIAMNQAYGVKASLGAVSGEPGRITLHSAGASTSSHDHQAGPAVTVDALPIRDILGSQDRIDLLKCDIEAAEFGVFAAMDGAHLRKIDRIAMEYHNFGTWDHSVIVRQLEHAGFQVWDRPNRKDAELGLLFAERKAIR